MHKVKKILFVLFTFFFVAGIYWTYSSIQQPQVSLDFSTTDSMSHTCSQLKEIHLSFFTQDSTKIAIVICRAVDLVKTVFMSQSKFQNTLDQLFINRNTDTYDEIRKKIQLSIEHIAASRKILESIHLKKPVFVIEPGNWQMDLDGDSTITPFEKYLFWVPKRKMDIPRRPFHEEEQEDYYQQYFISPKIQIDQSDVLWAIAYCHIAESILNILLAYDYNAQNLFAPKLIDVEKIKNNAYGHALKALAYSKKLHENLQKETDDHLEWIPNGKQKDTVFPLALDEQVFETWKTVLIQLEDILKGRTLLGANIVSRSGSKIHGLGLFCSSTTGVNIHKLFQQPLDSTKSTIFAYCQSPTKTTPISPLHKTLSEIYQRNTKTQQEFWDNDRILLRYLYWVN